MTIKFTAQNFGCLKDFSIELQPLHALIGPNDSGKSTVLKALATFGFHASGRGNAVDFRPYVRDVGMLTAEQDGHAQPMRLNKDGSVGVDTANPSALAGPLLVRLDPDHMRAASGLIPQDRAMSLLGDRGTGLAGVYDALLNRDVDSFLAIAQEVRRLFPGVKSLQLRNVNSGEKVIAIGLVTGETIPAEAVSEGLLYYLAFAALPHISKNNLVLIEEPENGLHPARIREVMNVLKEVSKTSQVVIATHSPLVINELGPDQVSIITRNPETGTKATPMRETKDFAERSSVFALGELWLSFADGDMEKDLVPEAKTQ